MLTMNSGDLDSALDSSAPESLLNTVIAFGGSPESVQFLAYINSFQPSGYNIVSNRSSEAIHCETPV
jgi:hypothetical protein